VNGKTLRSLVYLVVFAVITAFLTYVLAVTITNGSVGSTVSYKAQFSDTTGLLPGDDVRIAGVRIGQVKKVQLVNDCPLHQPNPVGAQTTSCSLVTFGVEKSISMASNVTVDVKYRNLVGQRYLDVLAQPDPTSMLAKNAIIPLKQTNPALDLTVLFDGFEPLFQGLNSQDTNDLAYEIVASLQGEGGNLDSLLSNTASLSTSIASQDSQIGSLIDNLNGVLSTVDARDGDLTNLIDQLQRLTTGLAGDRDEIASSLGNVNALATSTTQLLATIRPYLPTDLTQLSGVANTLATSTAVNSQGVRTNQLDQFLTTFPTKISSLTRTASYGGFFNFYLCRVNVSIADTNITVALQNDNAAVCDSSS
jgi:phospholipid/cholesterol/gamma-HCH transport system substrate-binding protein